MSTIKRPVSEEDLAKAKARYHNTRSGSENLRVLLVPGNEYWIKTISASWDVDHMAHEPKGPAQEARDKEWASVSVHLEKAGML